MGPAFVIIFWLILAGVFCALWMGSFLLFKTGRHRKSFAMTGIGAVVLTMLTVAAVALAGLIFTGFIRSCIPSYVFKDEFHVKPPNDISDIKSSTWSFADSGHTFLRFKASREALSRLLTNHVQMIYYAEFKEKADNWMDDESPPSWWVNPTNGAEIYSIGPQHSEGGTHSGEFVVLIYDASTGTAEYYSSWVD